MLTAIYFISRGSLEIIKDDLVVAILGKQSTVVEHTVTVLLYTVVTIGVQAKAIRSVKSCARIN